MIMLVHAPTFLCVTVETIVFAGFIRPALLLASPIILPIGRLRRCKLLMVVRSGVDGS
jgi:hypothetical protein